MQNETDRENSDAGVLTSASNFLDIYKYIIMILK